MNSCKMLLKVSAFLCIAFYFPSLTTTLLGGIVGFAVWTLIFAISNIQDEVLPNGNTITSAIDEIIDSKNYNSTDVINRTETSSTPTISMDKMKRSSSEIQSADAKLHTSSELEEKSCSERDDETTKDVNLIYPLVTKSSEVESKFSHAEDNAEDVLRIHASSSNPLGDVPGANTAHVHISLILPAPFTKDEVSTGHSELSNDLDINLDEVRTMITEETSVDTEATGLEDETFGKDVSRKYPLDTVPIEFIYPCLPYLQY